MLRAIMTHAFRLLVILAVCTAAACSSGSPSAPAAPAAVGSDAAAGADAAARGAEISGTVSRVGGSCPAIRFVVGRVVVQAGRTTTFVGGTCAEVVTGAGVVVRGARQSDGSLAASAVTIRGSQGR